MKGIYKFSLGIIIIILIFLSIESSQFGLSSYFQDTTYLNSKILNNNIRASRKQIDKKYLNNELEDLKKIEKVSILYKKKDNTEVSPVETETKRASGKNSIYVQALRSLSSPRRLSSSSINFPFNLQDSATGKWIRPSTMLEAHVTCADEVLKLPRLVTKQDLDVKFTSKFFNQFKQRYEKVLGYDLLTEERVAQDENRNKIKRAEKRLFKKYGPEVQLSLRIRLFENPLVIKASECRYRDYGSAVSTYYDTLSDFFAIVDPKLNTLLDFSVASEIDYVDIFRYKSVFQDRTRNELRECPSDDLNPFQLICRNPEEGPRRRNIDLTEQDRATTWGNFDKTRKIGLPENYDIRVGWWLARQQEIIKSFDSNRFSQLCIEMTKLGPVVDETRQIEALTILQAEQQNLVAGISRPDALNNLKEEKLNLDFKISSWNKEIFPGWKPTYDDIKSPLDPEVIRALDQGDQTLEDQVDNLLKTIPLQRQRAMNNGESVIHIITLLRIKPADRTYFMDNFKAKALLQNLDLNGIKFINTSSTEI